MSETRISRRIRNRRWLSPVLTAVFLCLSPITVRADMGPKSNLQIEILTDSTEPYTAAIISRRDSIGGVFMSIYSSNPDEAFQKHELTGMQETLLHKVAGLEGWNSFRYYFNKDTSGPSTLSLDYMPPDRFSAAVYFPDTDALILTDYRTINAFSSSYRLEITDDMLTPGVHSVTLKETSIQKILLQVLLRLAATILIELLVALLFGINSRQQLLFLLKLNLATQGLLNLGLAFAQYCDGMLLLLAYPVLELAVLLVEIRFDRKMLPELSTDGLLTKSDAGWYAFTANLLSFLAGILSVFSVLI